MAWIGPVVGAIGGAILENNSGDGASTSTAPWAGSLPYIQQLLRDAQAAYAGMDTQGYQGDLYAQLTPEQLATIQSAMGMSGLAPEAVGQAFSLGQSMLAGDFLNPETNPYLQNYMNAATTGVTEQFQRNVLPSLASGAVMSGGYGGSRQGVAEGLASGEYTQSVSDMLSNILMQNYSQERQNQMNTPAFLSQALGMGQQGLNMGYQAGGTLQADQQAQLDEAYQQYMMRQNAPWQAMAPFWNMASQAAGFGGTGTQTQGSNPWGAALGGAMLGSQVQQAWQTPAGQQPSGQQYVPAGSPANTPFFFNQNPQSPWG
jgi:hypothetical protein